MLLIYSASELMIANNQNIQEVHLFVSFRIRMISPNEKTQVMIDVD